MSEKEEKQQRNFNHWREVLSEQPADIEVVGIHMSLRRLLREGELSRAQAFVLVACMRPEVMCREDNLPGLFLEHTQSGYFGLTSIFECSKGHYMFSSDERGGYGDPTKKLTTSGVNRLPPPPWGSYGDGRIPDIGSLSRKKVKRTKSRRNSGRGEL